MNDRVASALDTIRPNVVRRRVVEFKREREEDLEEDGPPSSIDVSRALASLRGPDLERLEAIMREDEARDREG